MAVSRGEQLIVNAIDKNTKAIEKLATAMEKVARTSPPNVTLEVTGPFEGDNPFQLTDPDQYDPTKK